MQPTAACSHWLGRHVSGKTGQLNRKHAPLRKHTPPEVLRGVAKTTDLPNRSAIVPKNVISFIVYSTSCHVPTLYVVFYSTKVEFLETLCAAF